mmetsp:Transcript_28835/g.83669  ORF Transcript_28835/g.83669 Transcript_28835/m.83669 type:complete len:301 (-) Transcript_28835:882-1784(-)
MERSEGCHGIDKAGAEVDRGQSAGHGLNGSELIRTSGTDDIDLAFGCSGSFSTLFRKGVFLGFFGCRRRFVLSCGIGGVGNIGGANSTATTGNDRRRSLQTRGWEGLARFHVASCSRSAIGGVGGHPNIRSSTNGSNLVDDLDDGGVLVLLEVIPEGLPLVGVILNHRRGAVAGTTTAATITTIRRGSGRSRGVGRPPSLPATGLTLDALADLHGQDLESGLEGGRIGVLLEGRGRPIQSLFELGGQNPAEGGVRCRRRRRGLVGEHAVGDVVFNPPPHLDSALLDVGAVLHDVPPALIG